MIHIKAVSNLIYCKFLLLYFLDFWELLGVRNINKGSKIHSINSAVEEALDWDLAYLGFCLYLVTNCLQHL